MENPATWGKVIKTIHDAILLWQEKKKKNFIQIRVVGIDNQIHCVLQ